MRARKEKSKYDDLEKYFLSKFREMGIEPIYLDSQKKKTRKQNPREEEKIKSSLLKRE